VSAAHDNPINGRTAGRPADSIQDKQVAAVSKQRTFDVVRSTTTDCAASPKPDIEFGGRLLEKASYPVIRRRRLYVGFFLESGNRWSDLRVRARMFHLSMVFLKDWPQPDHVRSRLFQIMI
jgi:hypothetical protein